LFGFEAYGFIFPIGYFPRFSSRRFLFPDSLLA